MPAPCQVSKKRKRSDVTLHFAHFFYSLLVDASIDLTDMQSTRSMEEKANKQKRVCSSHHYRVQTGVPSTDSAVLLFKHCMLYSTSLTHQTPLCTHFLPLSAPCIPFLHSSISFIHTISSFLIDIISSSDPTVHSLRSHPLFFSLCSDWLLLSQTSNLISVGQLSLSHSFSFFPFTFTFTFIFTLLSSPSLATSSSSFSLSSRAHVFFLLYPITPFPATIRIIQNKGHDLRRGLNNISTG